MTIVVGFAPDGRSRAVLHLAAMLARSRGEDLVVCAVVPAPWPPSPAKIDAEYQAYLQGVAENALSRARARLPSDVPARFEVVHSHSDATGLLEMAEQAGAGMIVVGSSADGVSLGSTSSRLLHSSPVPVALAPRGFRTSEGARVERATVAFGGRHEDLVAATASVAARAGTSLRVAMFAVHPRAPYTSGVGREADDSIVAQWIEEVRTAAREVAPGADCAVGIGEDWADALEDIPWTEGDLLVVGSSTIGPIARVFLGSRAAKIIRHSPVPVVVVPRAHAEELASNPAE